MKLTQKRLREIIKEELETSKDDVELVQQRAILKKFADDLVTLKTFLKNRNDVDAFNEIVDLEKKLRDVRVTLRSMVVVS